MSQGQFRSAAMSELSGANKNDYVNARYAPVGNQKVGQPFPLFKQPAGYFTDYTPSGQTMSNYKRQMNLPTNNTLFRNTMSGDGVSLQNNQNTAWMYRTQTLSNNGEPMACRNDADCEAWPGTTCNPQYQSWTNAKGNQGNYCSTTVYPEMASGEYVRKTAKEGGIGKSCTTDSECASGYFCNNDTDIFGTNEQQTGYCSQVYECSDGKHYLGYPYNSGVPINPPPEQNNGGKGYKTKEQCSSSKLAQQDCVQGSNGNWFATYPGYCPVPTNLRSGGQPNGQLPSSSMPAIKAGISIPAYATNMSSSMTKPMSSFVAWNINSDVSQLSAMSTPFKYELSINPK